MKTNETLTNDQLLSCLANACTTYYEAGGHSKAQSNKNMMGYYIEELQKRKVNIPSDKELLEVGVFNGEGSY